jgi:hypothetical protein
MVDEPPRRTLKVTPLAVGAARRAGPERQQLRDAVLQVIHHLVLESVPVARRSHYFDLAAGLLDEAGWGLDELLAATREGPARDALFRALGLAER